MRSRLAAAAVVLVSVAVLITSGIGRAGDRMPSMSVPVKEAIEKMTKAKAPKGSIGTVRFFADVLDGKAVEFYMGDFTNAGMVDDHIVSAISKTTCGKLGDAQLKSAGSLLTEYGEALPLEVRGYILGQQGKADQAGPLLVKALQEMQPLDRCLYGHPDDAGKQSSRVNTWLGCYTVLTPKADQKKVEAIRKKSMECMAATFGTVG